MTLRNSQADAVRGAISGHLLLALVFSLLVNILFLASPLYMMQLYGRVLNSRSLETLASLSVVLVLALVAMAAADAARGRLLVRAAARIDRRLIDRAPAAGRGYAERIADLGAVRTFLSGTAATTLCDAPFTVLFLGLLFLIDPLLGLVATLGAAVILVAVFVTRLLSRAREERISATERGVRDMSTVLDADRGDLAMFGGRGLAARMSGALSDVAGWRQSGGETTASLGAFNRFIRMLAHSATLATGAVLTLDGQLSPAAMLASAILAGRALGPMETLMTALRQAGMARAALGRLTKADTSSTQVVAPDTRSAPVQATRGMVMIKGAARPALRGVTLDIAGGEVISVAGPTGSGKSTLARAIAGIEPLSGGQVRIAGVDPSAIAPEDRARLIGWMPQDVTLYPGTVADNIARFREAAPDEVLGAADKAGARAAIEGLPQGFATEVEAGGRNLTPGLRQQVALARALFGGPALVILDQPTAHMDAEGEVATLNAIRTLKQAGTTVIVISHKPVLAALADRILVLRDGMVEHFEEREKIVSLMRRQTLAPVKKSKEAAT